MLSSCGLVKWFLFKRAREAISRAFRQSWPVVDER